MSSIPLRAVVDASVAVKLFVPEPHSEQARAVFEAFASHDDAELLVPDFFFLECANVFWKWVQRVSYAHDRAHRHLSDLLGLGLTVIPNQILVQDALGLALKHKVTAYDASYVAAAVQLDLPLLTADEKLARKIAADACDVQWVGDLK